MRFNLWQSDFFFFPGPIGLTLNRTTTGRSSPPLLCLDQEKHIRGQKYGRGVMQGRKGVLRSAITRRITAVPSWVGVWCDKLSRLLSPKVFLGEAGTGRISFVPCAKVGRFPRTATPPHRGARRPPIHNGQSHPPLPFLSLLYSNGTSKVLLNGTPTGPPPPPGWDAHSQSSPSSSLVTFLLSFSNLLGTLLTPLLDRAFLSVSFSCQQNQSPSFSVYPWVAKSRTDIQCNTTQ